MILPGSEMQFDSHLDDVLILAGFSCLNAFGKLPVRGICLDVSFVDERPPDNEVKCLAARANNSVLGFEAAFKNMAVIQEILKKKVFQLT